MTGSPSEAARTRRLMASDWRRCRLCCVTVANRRPSWLGRGSPTVGPRACHVCRYNGPVSTVSIRDLANNASAVVDEVATSGRPAVVTKHGKPVAAVVPIDQEALEDWVLANGPEFVANMAEANEEIAAGVRGKPLGRVLGELDE